MKPCGETSYPRPMSTSHAPLDRAGLRRSVLQLASLQLLALLLLGLLSLFAAWSMNREHERSLQELAAISQAVGLGRSAQLDIKRQVQEWKNILLRGSDPAQLDAYAKAEREARDRANAHLKELRTFAVVQGRTDLQRRVEETLALHGTLSDTYDQGTSKLRESPGATARVDASVRGVDRPVDEALDLLVKQLDDSLPPRIVALRDTARQRFEALTTTLWTMLAIATMLVGFGVWRVIGGSRNRAA